MTSKFVLERDPKGHVFFDLKDEGGELLLRSPVWSSLVAAKSGVALVRQCALKVENFEARPAPRGGTYAFLHGSHGKVLGRTSVFTTPEELQQAIQRLRHLVLEAPLTDHTRVRAGPG